jgi:hypothetical protein
VKIEIRGIPDRNKPLEQYIPSTERAESELALRQIIDLEQALRKTIQSAKISDQ